MTVFTVHEPPSPPADRARRAEQLLFIRDGFAWGAALLGPVWLAMYKHWRALQLWGGAMVAISAVLLLIKAGPGSYVLLLAALGAIVGFEAGDLERERLAAEGWTDLGLARGRGREEAEAKFLGGWLEPSASPSPDAKRAAGDGGAASV